LKLNGGDIKSVQGDSGHAQVKMVTDVYSHIIDDDRRLNAQRFEEQFYQPKKEMVVEEERKELAPEASGLDQEMLLKILANPEMAGVLKALAKNL
jgi:ribosomal 30S subunit maturation factor RimM